MSTLAPSTTVQFTVKAIPAEARRRQTIQRLMRMNSDVQGALDRLKRERLRSGNRRTARAGRGGVAWTFVTPEQGELLSNIENLINAEVPKLDYPEFIAKPAPEGYRAALPGGRREGGLQIARIGEEISAPGSPAPAPKAQPPKQGKYEATLNPIMPAQAAKVDESKFPGGIVPSKLPPKRLIRGFKTGR
jgi:hypothetical protein